MRRRWIWLLKLGLADLLYLPLDLSKLEVEFQNVDLDGQAVVIINLAGISYEICPRLPEPLEGLSPWQALVGRYQRYARLPSGAAGLEEKGQEKIVIVDDQLHMSGLIGPILPIDARTIIVLTGPFASETLSHDMRTGNLYHQGHVYVPVTSIPE